MDFYLSDGKRRLLFPINPQQVTATTAARLITYESISLGQFSLPRGSIPTQFSWEGVLPGALRNSAFVKSWQDPKTLLGYLSGWRSSNQKLRLLITETPINHDVYITNLEHTWLGGHGDAQYNITLVESRSLLVTEGGQKNTASSSKSTNGTSARPVPPSPKTYTVKQGDNLWGIAKKNLGSGSRHAEIYNLNKKIIGSDPSKIKPGQVLRLPV